VAIDKGSNSLRISIFFNLLLLFVLWGKKERKVQRYYLDKHHKFMNVRASVLRLSISHRLDQDRGSNPSPYRTFYKMDLLTLYRSTRIWFVLMLLSVVDGLLVEYYIKIKFPIPEVWAQRSHAFFDTSLFFVVVFVWWDATGLKSWGDVKLIAGLWVLMTAIVNIFVINTLVLKMSYEQGLQRFDALDGGSLPFVLVWIGLLPLICRDLKGPSSLSAETREKSQ
jgi:hypothetical protein